MMKLISFLILLILTLLLSGCSKKKSFFDTPIQKDRGHLKFLNTDGFIGAIAVGTTFDFELTLKSTGGLDVKNIIASLVTNDPITYKDGLYPGSGGDCGSELSSGSTCKIILTYAPTNLASHLASLNFTYSDAIASSSYNLSITADSHPILTFEYGSLYDFGNKFVGSSTDLRIKISNTGRVNAESISINNLSAPFSFKGGAYPGIGGSCGTRIIVGQNCEIIINYSPTTNGQHLQDITLDYLNVDRPEQNTLNLLAWGFNESQLSINSASGNDFGTVPNNNNNSKTFTVTHVGGDVSANLLTLSGLSAPFSRIGGSCGTILTIDQGSCTIIIALNSSSSGTWSNTMSFSYFNGKSTVTIQKGLTGVTKERPVLSLTPSGTTNFGIVKVGSTATLPLTVTYVSGELPANSISLAGYSAPFSTTGGTCTTSLSSGSCTINLRFAPTSNATWTMPVTLTYNNTVSNVSVSGSTLYGKSDGRIAPNSASLNFSSVISGQSKDLSIRINYTGGSAVTNISVQSLTGPYSFVTGTYPGSTSDGARCGTGISTGSCYLYLRFSPVSEGTFNGNALVLTYGNGVDQSTMTLTLNGTGSPAANITLENKTYPSTPMNSAVPGPSMVRMTNSSTMPATSLSVNLPSGFSYRGGAYPGLAGNCGSSLGGNGTCDLDIAFTPLAATAYSSTLSVNYNDGSVIRTASSTLTGIGTTSSELYISNFDQASYGSIYLGRVPYQSKVFKIGHGGSATAATINSKSFSSSDFTITADTCPASLNNGETCSVTIAFTPQVASAITSSFMVTYDNGGGASVASRTLKGTGLAIAVITAAASPLSFGSLPTGASYDLDFTLTKVGAVISSPIGTISGSGFTFKGGAYPGTGGTCPTSGAFPSSCKVMITFTPVALVSYAGAFNLNYSNGYQSAFLTNSLTGSGFPTAKLQFVSSPYSFGQVIQTAATEKTITVTNSGSDAASALSFSDLSQPFRYKGGSYPGTGGSCSTTLSVSQSCTLVLEFAPTSVGVSGQSLTLTYHNGLSSVNVSTTLTGEGLAQAIISISEGNPYFFGTTNVAGAIDKSFILTNAGSVSGTALSGSFSSVFSFKGGTFPGAGGTCTTAIAAGTTCTIVLTFSPAAANSYSGLFTLNYYDGLRLQTELKNLTGNGSTKLLELNLFEAIKPQIVEEDQLLEAPQTMQMATMDLNLNGFSDEIESSISHNPKKSFVLKGRDGLDQRLIYKVKNHLPKHFYQGLNGIKVIQDFNHDQIPDVLIGIYRKSGRQIRLVGFDVICQRTGNILIRYLPRY